MKTPPLTSKTSITLALVLVIFALIIAFVPTVRNPLFSLFQPNGATILRVMPGNPAEKASLQRDDKILEINNISIQDPYQASRILKQNAGRQVPLLILRQGKKMNVVVQLNPENTPNNSYLGVEFINPTFKLKDQ